MSQLPNSIGITGSFFNRAKTKNLNMNSIKNVNIENTTKATVLYLSHGGGPLPLINDKDHLDLVKTLKKISKLIKKPSAIIVISAHWEENRPTVLATASPSLLYDYYGFPESTYHIKYPLLGHPELAQQLANELGNKNLLTKLEQQRGFDHGVFVPLKIMYPDADIPCVQLSLMNSLNPSDHIKMGEALANLKQENLLIIGSGFSFHNMSAFFAPNDANSRDKNEQFEHWLIDTMSNKKMIETERESKIKQWTKAPFARYCHPREEHLLPLHVCYGATKRACETVFTVNILGKKASMYLW